MSQPFSIFICATFDVSDFLAALCGLLTWIPGACDQTLVDLLANIPTSTTEITLTTDFNTIHDHAFSSFPSLSRLTLSYNKIHTVYVQAFHGLKNLEYLDLSHNIITYLPPGLFDTVGENSNQV